MNFRNVAAIINYKCVFIVFLVLFITTSALAQDDEMVELRARLMQVELNENLLIVAEKKVILQSHEEGGKKVWDTLFFNGDGDRIDPQDLNNRDRLLILGVIENRSETITAHEVRLVSD